MFPMENAIKYHSPYEMNMLTPISCGTYPYISDYTCNTPNTL